MGVPARRTAARATGATGLPRVPLGRLGAEGVALSLQRGDVVAQCHRMGLFGLGIVTLLASDQSRRAKRLGHAIGRL